MVPTILVLAIVLAAVGSWGLFVLALAVGLLLLAHRRSGRLRG
jgi:hypothetical protein